MKAHDLIHGGLYLIGDSQIVRFYALNGGFYTLDGDFFGNPFADAESGEIECFTVNKNWLKISPIPLTPEILSSQGFVQTITDTLHIWTKDSFSIEIDLRTWEYYWASGDVILLNVHQLQQALRLCGVHDLADNFKV